jgi:hypothetical protein
MNGERFKFVLHGLAILVLTLHAPIVMADSGNSPALGLVKEVRNGTRMYKDVTLAESDGWGSTLNCVSGDDEGAMGVHYVNGALLFDNAALDPQRPEALIYETRHGRTKLVGVEFIILAEEWDNAHPDGSPPVLLGQLFHYIGSPNRYRLPAVYALHVWAWKDNPKGAFVHWNPRVSCDEYEG